MCLVLVAWQCHPRYPLIVAANRDEWRDRPTEPAHRWPSGVVAGRDLRAGGTWLGLRPDGSFAATTNVREPGAPLGGRSRGELPVRALDDGAPLAARVADVHRDADLYAGFHLLAADRHALWHVSNRGARGPTRLAPGLHGVSNGSTLPPRGARGGVWPKVRGGLAALEAALRQAEPDPEELLSILVDRVTPPDEELPDTGVGLDMERALAPRFLDIGPYGTRCSTVVLVGREVRLLERTWDPGGGQTALTYALSG